MIREFRMLGLLSSIAGPLQAQQPVDTASLPDLVITATAVPVRPEALTSAVTVLSGAELRTRGVRFVHDALREVPGLAVVQQGSYGAVTSLFARGGESDYVKVLIDGVPANQPGGSFDFATLSLDNVERIEIVRGPASVLHGSDAVAGVVQIFTRSGSPRLRAWAGGGGGSHGTHALDAALAGGTDRLGWSVGGSRLGTGGTYAFNNDFENTVVSAKVTARRDDRSRLAVAVRAGWNRAEFPTDGVGAPVDSNQSSSGHTVTAGAEGARDLHHRITANVSVTLADSRFEFADRSDSPGDTSGFAFASERDLAVTRLGGRIGVDFRPVSGATLSAGAQLERDHEQQDGTATSNFGAGPFTELQPPFDHARSNKAYYLQGTADLEQGLGATAGIRLDDNEAFGEFVTARAGLAYRLPSATRVRASIGTAFKAPTFSENFAATPFETGNPALEPERTRSWEVGVEQGIVGGRIALMGAWFDQQFRNLIQYVPAAPGAPTYENLGAAHARGLETGARFLVGGGISLTAHYTYLETEVTGGGAGASPSFADGERLLRRPTHAGRAAVTLRRAGFGASAAVTATGDRDDVDFATFERVALPAFTTLDISSEVDVLTRATGTALSLLVRIDNALDEEYQSVAGYPGRRRTIFAGARIER